MGTGTLPSHVPFWAVQFQTLHSRALIDGVVWHLGFSCFFLADANSITTRQFPGSPFLSFQGGTREGLLGPPIAMAFFLPLVPVIS
jgi:hypothetical protein